MGELWKKLEGKKTNIGSFLLLVAVILNEVVVGIWEVNPSWMHNAISTLNWCGMAVTGTGLADKIRRKEILAGKKSEG